MIEEIEGYINAVVHESFLKIIDDWRFGDLLQQDHVLHPTLLQTVPVTSLQTQTHTHLLIHWVTVHTWSDDNWLRTLFTQSS